MNRETMIAEISHDLERVQYDGDDDRRMGEAAQSLIGCMVDFTESLSTYNHELDTEADEASADRIAIARRDLIARWAAVQGCVSKMAYTLRIDGETAYGRLIEAVKSDELVNMEGL